MTPVALSVARSGAAITPMTTSAAKLLRVVNSQHLAIGMADKRTRQTVGRFTWSIGCEVCGNHVYRFANAGVTYFATIDDLVCADADLVTENRIIIVGSFRFQPVDRARRCADKIIAKIVVALLGEFGRAFEQFRFFC